MAKVKQTESLTNEEIKNQELSEKEQRKLEKRQAKEQKKAAKDKKRKEKKSKAGLGKRLKETVSELKKVSWPSFGTVVKKTCVVLVVVLFFTVVLFGFDYVLGLLYKLFTSNL